jgi:hypothetical protein
MKNFGTRAEVMHGTAKQTTGRLLKKDLMKNKHGEIVSRKKHIQAKKDNRLVKAGYFTKKGVFGFVRRDQTKKTKSKRKSRRV